MQLVSDKLLDDEGDKTHAWFVKTWLGTTKPKQNGKI
jgi:hypothetical protein